MELFVKIFLKIKKKIFLKACLIILFVKKKDVAYHFPRRTIHYENPLLSGKVNRQHKKLTNYIVGVDKLSANTNLLFIIGPGLLLIKQFVTKSNLFRETLHERVQ